MELKVNKFEEKYLEECVDLFIDTFSKEPWNDEYDSRDQVKAFFINHIEKLLLDENVQGMILNTEKDYPSCKFYEKNGFRPLGNLIVLGK